MRRAIMIAAAAAAALALACDGSGSGFIGVGGGGDGGGGGGGGGSGNPAAAAVQVTSFAFVPNSVSIRPGGTVVWTWPIADTTTHNVTFANSAYSSGNRNVGSHAVQFPTAGSFPYQCTIHNGMNGLVTVQ